ncbi:MAG: N-acetyl-alpha-D-glucosaminyl L-malate synthase BshA [Actinobacteria bacterium]|nr:N-acetyl-alpha-D-glucosaminyl L-malate synthase BshA [Actinomycetota bacterium]
MRIGITCYPTYGGSGAVAAELGIELAKMGHSIHFISYGLPFRLNRTYKNIYFHEVEVFDYPLFKYPPYSLSLSAKMSEVIENEKLDILHVHYAMPHAASAYLAQKIVGEDKIKFITTLHGTDITLVGNHHSFYKITKFSIENSNGITCVSEYLRNATEEIFKIKKKMQIIYNFVDTEKYKKIEVYENHACYLDFIDKDDKVITHISNFRPVKNIQKIIKIFCRVSREIKSKLILIGDGPELSRCQFLVEKLKLKNKVFFMGWHDDVIPYQGIHFLYMLPSKSESFGLSALEAMSCEVPVIGTSVGGLPEVVEDGISGYLFNPDEIEKMSLAAIKILGNDEIRYKMGLEARKRAKLFDSRIIVPKYLQYYNEILNKA